MLDIVDAAINVGTFNTLVTAITTAGLDGSKGIRTFHRLRANR